MARRSVASSLGGSSSSTRDPAASSSGSSTRRTRWSPPPRSRRRARRRTRRSCARRSAGSGRSTRSATGWSTAARGSRRRSRSRRAVVAELEALTALAPLHQPRSLAGIAAVSEALPGVPAVACFDTAFHATIPDAAATYAIPREWRERWAIRRYGFHGLSHAYASRRRRRSSSGGAGDPALRVVTCHLGAGASLAAVLGGRSVDTTMGFTPLEGLVMATRSGTVDPGLVLWLATEQGVAPAELTEGLERRSGLLGLGGSADMRDDPGRGRRGRRRRAPGARRLRPPAASVDRRDGGLARRPRRDRLHRWRRRAIGRIRGLAADGLAFLGIALDPDANGAATGEPRRRSAPAVPASRGVRDPGARGRRDRARRPGDRLRDLIANVWPHFGLRPSRVATYARNRVIP